MWQEPEAGPPQLGAELRTQRPIVLRHRDDEQQPLLVPRVGGSAEAVDALGALGQEGASGGRERPSGPPAQPVTFDPAVVGAAHERLADRLLLDAELAEQREQ